MCNRQSNLLQIKFYGTIVIMRFLYSLIIILFFVPVVNAKDDTQHKLFTRYITQNTEYMNALTSQNKKLAHLTFSDCQEDISFKRLKPQNLITPYFTVEEDKDKKAPSPKSFNPARGQWIEKTIASGCQKDIILNQLISAQSPDKTPVIFPFINGQTKIDAIYYSNVFKTIQDKLQNSDIKCFGQFFTQNTQFLGYKIPDKQNLDATDHGAGWFERWFVNACNKEFITHIAVLPDARTAYRFIGDIKQ